MIRWLTSVLLATTAIHFASTSDAVRDWLQRPAASAAELLEAGNLYLGSTSALKRDRLASIERVVDFTADHPVRKSAAAIGMLFTDFVGADGKLVSYNCTAALIRADLVITNHHCVTHGGTTPKEATLWLQHTTETAAQVVALNPVLVESDQSLDYALLQLVAPMDSLPRIDLGHLAIRAAVPGERLFIIHHSNGDPEQVSRAFCHADLAQPNAAGEIVHSCPTLRGSSGALVFAESDGAIVGLHHSISRRTDTTIGYATPMTAIALKSRRLGAQAANR